jgi:hypothetical protein
MPPTLKMHFLHSAAMAATSMPLSAIFELFVLRIAPLTAGKIRLYMLILIFLGLGSLIAMLRATSLRLTRRFHIGANGRITLHDFVFLLLVNAVLVPIIYLLSGANWRQILAATGLSVMISIFTGPLNGAAIDLFRVSAGYPSARQFGQSGKKRPLLIVGLIALSTAFTLALFALAVTIGPRT